MVEEIPQGILIDPPNPVMIVNERVYRECGCSLFIGVRVDKMEPATNAASCCDEHDQAIGHFNLLLMESLAAPQDRLLADVAEELMDQAFEYYGIE